jgi:hypothetical protein
MVEIRCFAEVDSIVMARIYPDCCLEIGYNVRELTKAQSERADYFSIFSLIVGVVVSNNLFEINLRDTCEVRISFILVFGNVDVG